MRLIDAEGIHYTRLLSRQGLDMELVAKVAIDDMPTVDAVEVIRCGDCEHYVKSPFGHAKLGWCKIDGKHRSREFYCAHADRRGANEET